QDLFNPDFSSYTSNWTAEATISHELAHHWFGDNTTCRSLGSIWLNESFASYCMMLWDEKRVGEEYLQFETWLALQAYLKFVENNHIIRPMEYRRFDTREEIYNEQTTYLKGGVVLNMLRWIMGDDDFFKGMSYYLHKHNFSNVESTDLKIALEEATGKNLDWFFQQWVYSGGNPRFEVSYTYIASKKKLELTVKQTQPLVKGQMVFRLPVEIRIDTKLKKMTDTVWVENQTEHVLFDVSEKPIMVSFDGRGVLVCDLMFDKSQEELIYQLGNDALPGKLWALHQLVNKFSSSPKTLNAMKSVLNGNGAWWLKSEAALQLQHLHIDGAEELLIQQLKAKDYHIRNAAALALGFHFTKSSASALRNAVQSDPNTTVAGMAAISLAKIDPSLSTEFFKTLLSRSSWYDELRFAALVAMGQLENEKFVPLIKGYVSSKYNMAVRQQALESWAACAPNDLALIDALLTAARKEISRVRASAIGLLGKFKVERALPLLEEIGKKDGDSDIRTAAHDAFEEIQRVAAK
ncbi:MAG: HEAT repeat domain-containing protein, partial [Ignavibacteriales bacterium]|nr:HEAT repeat domain-containing protein [Ignavibacteriales bacterium]